MGNYGRNGYANSNKTRLKTLKNLKEKRISYALMLLAFWACGVLGCRRVLVLAEASGTLSAADNLA